MTTYELMIKTNHYLIKGDVLTDPQKRNIVQQFFSAKSKPEVDKYKSEMLNWLCNKSCVMNSEHNKTIHPVLFSVLRNNLAKYPEYEYIKGRQPYVSEKDGRLHFDMEV